MPFATEFSSDFGDFFAPSGNGYNWGHDWREEKYQSWVTASNRTVTASMQANELAGKEFLMKVMIDPVEVVGGAQSFGVAACGSNREFGSYYLADVKPSLNTFRILQISGGVTSVAAERAINNLSLTDLDPFELELSGTRSGNSITLELTIRKDGQSDRLIGTDTTSLDGSYFGLRCRNEGTRYECHFDNYELGPLHRVEVTSSPEKIALVGEYYEYQAVADAAGSFMSVGAIPSWLSLSPSGLLSGTPGMGDVGVGPVTLLVTSDDGATAKQEFDITVPAVGGVVISEFMANNDDTLVDSEGESSDWIEIFNATSTAVDLTGWSLTDDPTMLGKWNFANGTMIPPRGHLLVFASGKSLPGHASFRLSDAEGSYLALVDPGSSVVSEFNGYPKQKEDISYGRYGTYLEEGFLLEATPGEPNVAVGYTGFTADTTFSETRGFFDAAFFSRGLL